MTARLAAAPPLVPSPETDLVAFAWLVAFVLAGFLVLARLSQGVVDDESDRDQRADRDEGHGHDEREGRNVGYDGTGPTASRREDFHFDTARDAGDETARDADQPDVGEPDAGESSPVAHPLAPSGAVGQTSSGDDYPNVSRDDHPTPSRDDRQVGPPPVPHTGEPPALSPGLLLLNVALTQGLFGAILAGGAWYFGVPLPTLGISSDALSTGLPALAVGVGFGLALWVGNELASGLAASSGADYDEGLREMLAPDGPRAWALLLGATLPVIAVVEEFIFRAAVVGATTEALGASPWLLAVVSSVAFALGHGAQGRVGVVVTGALGFALAAGFVLTNSLLVVIVAHYLVNALEFFVHEGLGLPDPIWS
ncbi:CPBP family intramembrane glutamic endopeptidase [Halosimplex amylolyticum]|uniref:CPBP family intramembrane glutamic endopeptidase n=1 Tax=Halosimplex amylolyticum TaxID=3396616 RepID=UPI003F57B14E